eukprot:Sspe_Gene.83378::Locus_54696_Transcript_1_2_Confidence_0.667_Length_1627::g.83378::m.83378
MASRWGFLRQTTTSLGKKNRPAFWDERARQNIGMQGAVEHKNWQAKTVPRIPGVGMSDGMRRESSRSYFPTKHRPAFGDPKKEIQDNLKAHDEKLQEMREKADREFAAAAPMLVRKERSSVSQAVVDWKQKTESMPIGETEITSRKHSVVKHLIMLRSNPKYRWNHERFILSDPAGISELAQREYPPEVLLLDASTVPPKHLDLDKTAVVYTNRYVLSAIVGPERSKAGMVAEYLIPDETPKRDLFEEKFDAQIRRMAVLVDVQEPAHLGALMRAAMVSGCDAILLMDNCIDPYEMDVLDVSKACNVTAGGYPRVHILRAADGDDAWGIINRTIRRHNLLPVVPAEEGQVDTVSPTQLWQELRETGDIDQGMCFFFGSAKYGLDTDYVMHNLEKAPRQLQLTNAATIPMIPAVEASLMLEALREPVFVSPVPPVDYLDTKAAKVRLVTPITREIQELRRDGIPYQAPLPTNPPLRVTKHYRSRRLGGEAYKTEVDLDHTGHAAMQQEALEAAAVFKTKTS